MIPYAGETESVAIELFDQSLPNETSQCVVRDPRTISMLIDCLTPNERSTFAADMVAGLPLWGKLTFYGPRGSTLRGVCQLGHESSSISGTAGKEYGAEGRGTRATARITASFSGLTQ